MAETLHELPTEDHGGHGDVFVGRGPSKGCMGCCPGGDLKLGVPFHCLVGWGWHKLGSRELTSLVSVS